MNRSILAIDPGIASSGYALIDSETRKPLSVGKIPNDQILHLIATTNYTRLSVEMIASYGMAVGAEVFETCVWIGRFIEHHLTHSPAHVEHALIYRREVKLHHCQSTKAKDANITQALIDRFAYGEPNRGKGTKANPGWFYGFAADIWQAYAIAVLTADTIQEGQ